LGASLAQGYVHFSSVWDFMMGLGKPQPHANFELIASAVAELLWGTQNVGELP